MNRRMKTINTFEFLPVHVDENVNCIISITGYIHFYLLQDTFLTNAYYTVGYLIQKKMKHLYLSVHWIN